LSAGARDIKTLEATTVGAKEETLQAVRGLGFMESLTVVRFSPPKAKAVAAQMIARLFHPAGGRSALKRLQEPNAPGEPLGTDFSQAKGKMTLHCLDDAPFGAKDDAPPSSGPHGPHVVVATRAEGRGNARLHQRPLESQGWGQRVRQEGSQQGREKSDFPRLCLDFAARESGFIPPQPGIARQRLEWPGARESGPGMTDKGAASKENREFSG
jgi:hypothetical protein